MRKHLAAGLATLAVGMGVAQPASAAPPQQVSIVVATTFDDLPDDITSVSGALGATCTGGITTDTFFHAAPNVDKWTTNSGKAQLRVGKVFHCAGGEFSAALTVTLDFDSQETTGTWVITTGTGDFAQLRGHGAISGVPVDGGIEDSYTGVVTGI